MLVGISLFLCNIVVNVGGIVSTDEESDYQQYTQYINLDLTGGECGP